MSGTAEQDSNVGKKTNQLGNETRSSLMPTVEPTGIGFTGPSYSAATAIPKPNEVGVRDEGSIGATMDAISAAAYYADTIGFGTATNYFSRRAGRPVEVYGVNYFLKTSQTCSNGEPLYVYVEGIPTGNALGKNVGDAFRGLGKPLTGLAPGVVEDAMSGLNPTPIVGALFGKAYPICKKITAQVGDPRGRIKDPDSGEFWVDDPNSVFYQTVGGRRLAYQTKWVEDYMTGRDEYMAKGGGETATDKKVEAIRKARAKVAEQEGFMAGQDEQMQRALIVLAGVFLTGSALLYIKR
jgi:hypothetical protein